MHEQMVSPMLITEHIQAKFSQMLTVICILQACILFSYGKCLDMNSLSRLLDVSDKVISSEAIYMWNFNFLSLGFRQHLYSWNMRIWNMERKMGMQQSLQFL